MEKKHQSTTGEGSEQRYDLSEESGRRGSEEATSAARQEESDDVNEYNGTGKVSSGGWGAENKVSTSLDDE